MGEYKRIYSGERCNKNVKVKDRKVVGKMDQLRVGAEKEKKERVRN